MDYILESIKRYLGENSVGWRRIEENINCLNGIKEWLKDKEEYKEVLQKIQELENGL